MSIKGLNIIKLSLILVYFWFGFLKILGTSPVADLVKTTYPSLPPEFIVFLGVWEVLIALFLINRKTLKIGLVLMWIQLGCIFLGAVINLPIYFTDSNIFTPNTNGEFVIKNFILLAASLTLWKD